MEWYLAKLLVHVLFCILIEFIRICYEVKIFKCRGKYLFKY